MSPASRFAAVVILLICLVFAGLFALGYGPRQKRLEDTVAAAQQAVRTAPFVSLARVKRASQETELALPGNVQAVGETPVYARAEGYIVKRFVDIGDRVKAGQVLVEIDSPELDQQVRTSQARVAQLRAALALAQANEKQVQSQLALATSTLGRVRQLVQEGVLAKQMGDEKLADFNVRTADLEAVRANIRAAEENIRAGEGEVHRLSELQSFKRVSAPWDGIITVRNCAVGNLITPTALASGRELFRLADVTVLRVFIDVPEIYVPAVRAGQEAKLTLQEYPGRVFHGQVTRLANALDTSARTMRVEVQVKNLDRALMPGMYAQVKMKGNRKSPPWMIPGDTIVGRPEGDQVAIVKADGKVTYRKIRIGRDFGTEVEVLEGLNGTESLVVNPSDEIREGEKVQTAQKAPDQAPNQATKSGH